MHYATHVVSPCLGLVDGLADYVSCFGSGTVRDDIAKKSGNKFAVESCHIKIKDSDLTAHIWRFLYDVARQYRESFDVYGTKKSFEWTLIENEPHTLFIPPRNRNRRFPRRSKFPTSRICCPLKFESSRFRKRFTTPNTCRSFREAAMAVRIHTWSTSSPMPCWKTAIPGPTRSPVQTGRASEFVPTNRHSKAGNASTCPNSLVDNRHSWITATRG
jgi:hypothetical protein